MTDLLWNSGDEEEEEEEEKEEEGTGKPPVKRSKKERRTRRPKQQEEEEEDLDEVEPQYIGLREKKRETKVKKRAEEEQKAKRRKEKKRKKPLRIKPQRLVTRSLNASLSLPSSFASSSPLPLTHLNTSSGIEQSATFAVWNLWDLGGGPNWRHWTEEALSQLPDELVKINADVLGLLEIKTGKVWEQLPQEKLEATAFEIGAMTALMFFWARKKKHLNGIEKMMWTAEDQTPLKKGLASRKGSLKIPKRPLFPVKCEDEDDRDAVVKDVLIGFIDLLNGKTQTNQMFETMRSMCVKMPGEYLTESPTYFPKVMVTLKSEKQKILKATFRHVQRAFSNAGTVQLAKERPRSEEAKGIDLIEPVLKTFCLKKPEFSYCILPKEEGLGETTAFLFDKTKFKLINHFNLPIMKKPDRFRSAGCVLLEGLSGTLKNSLVLAVAWHAPSENHVGNRAWAYTKLLKQIKGVLVPGMEAVLLADMNIRKNPGKSESNIVSTAYDEWRPKQEIHMELRTSLKKKGSGEGRWNHPFDKVLLLKQEDSKLKIGEIKRMEDVRRAEEIRKFSDHSWAKAIISPK